MGESGITDFPTNGSANPPDGGGQQARQEWVRAHFTEIFGTSAEALQAQGINPRQYAREHRDQIRQFAQLQRSQGIAVPPGRASGTGAQGWPGGPGAGGQPGGPGADGWGSPNGRSGYNGRFGYGRLGGSGMGMRGGGAWIGIVLVLFVLRLVLVDSVAGAHSATYWVLGIGGVMLVARLFLFSWLRKRRINRRQRGGDPYGGSGL